MKTSGSAPVRISRYGRRKYDWGWGCSGGSGASLVNAGSGWVSGLWRGQCSVGTINAQGNSRKGWPSVSIRAYTFWVLDPQDLLVNGVWDFVPLLCSPFLFSSLVVYDCNFPPLIQKEQPDATSMLKVWSPGGARGGLSLTLSLTGQNEI